MVEHAGQGEGRPRGQKDGQIVSLLRWPGVDQEMTHGDWSVVQVRTPRYSVQREKNRWGYEPVGNGN